MKRKYSSSDFSVKMLPLNRKKQFLDLYKTRFSIIFKIILLVFLFSMPILLSYFIKYFYVITNAYNELKGNTDSYVAFYKLTNIIFYSIDIATFAILSIGLAGVCYIFKKIAWGEPVYFIKDFGHGIKQNWSIYLVSSIFISIFRFAVKSFVILSNYHFISYFIEGIFILLLPIFFFAVNLYEIYEVGIFEAYSKAAKYYFRKFAFVLLFLVYIIAIEIINHYVVEVYGLILVGLIILIFNMLLLLPNILLIWHLFCLSCFDEITNKEHFIEYYHKGLSDNYIFTKKYDDDETFLLK